MKKILLIVVAIMMAGVMSAQPFQSNKNNKVLPAKPMPAMMQAKVNRDIKAAPQEYRRMSTKPLDFGKKLSVMTAAEKIDALYGMANELHKRGFKAADFVITSDVAAILFGDKDFLDYYDLSTNPPTFRHYDGTTGEFQSLNPFGKH